MLLKKIKQNKDAIGFGIALSLLLILMRFLEFRLLIASHQYEIYIGVIAVVFTLLGIWVAQKITTPKTKTVIIEKEVFISDTANFTRNEIELSKRKISKRELEVLELMSNGLSNQEIAEKLFVSLNTIKTHASNLFEKLDAKRRQKSHMFWIQ